MNLLKQLQSLLLPITVIIIVPGLLLPSTGTPNPLWGQTYPLNMVLLVVSLFLLALGLTLIISTIRLFITIGQGTLAPWTPTQRLVVVGPYRYVRNPMISGVMSMVLSEAVLSGSLSLLVWAIFVVVINLVYIPLSEEPGLVERFGDDYRDYTRHVPRWIPRRTPWTQPDQS